MSRQAIPATDLWPEQSTTIPNLTEVRTAAPPLVTVNRPPHVTGCGGSITDQLPPGSAMTVVPPPVAPTATVTAAPWWAPPPHTATPTPCCSVALMNCGLRKSLSPLTPPAATESTVARAAAVNGAANMAVVC